LNHHSSMMAVVLDLVEILHKLGLQRLASMRGGMAAWRQAKLAVKR